jgi:hypothetical protein
MNRAFCVLAAAAMLAVTSAASASVVFSDLGTTAPPTTLGGFKVEPFSQAPQTAIPDNTVIGAIPGGPGSVQLVPTATKKTVPTTWSTWSNGYTGAVYNFTGTTGTLNLSPGKAAFYFYAEPDTFGSATITAVTNIGGTSGPITVTGSSGAHGFGFYTTSPGEVVTSITITQSVASFAVGELGTQAVDVIPTLSDAALLALGLVVLAIGFVAVRSRTRTA